jgi:hypothetical protein
MTTFPFEDNLVVAILPLRTTPLDLPVRSYGNPAFRNSQTEAFLLQMVLNP